MEGGKMRRVRIMRGGQEAKGDEKVGRRGGDGGGVESGRGGLGT